MEWKAFRSMAITLLEVYDTIKGVREYCIRTSKALSDRMQTLFACAGTKKPAAQNMFRRNYLRNGSKKTR